MNEPLTADVSAIKSQHTGGRRREHLFFTGMTVAILITVFAGFAPTYFLKGHFNGSPLTPLVHLHGIIFSSWMVLLLVQTTLVAAGRVRIHMSLGLAGAVVAALMVLIGTATAIKAAAMGHSPPGAPPPLVFLVIPLGEMVTFPILVGCGFYFRRRPDVHKRLMLLASIAILSAAVARLPFEYLKAGPPAFFGTTDLFLLPCLLYDLVSRRRPHPATVLGGLFIVGSQVLRLMIGGTQVWHDFATWLTKWAA
jgi:hypothetical protein